jgi:hypothetical protein
MIGPHLHTRPRFSIDGQRHERDVSESTHAQFGEDAARTETSGGLDASVDHACAGGERAHRDSQFVGSADTGVCECPGALVHLEICHLVVCPS